MDGTKNIELVATVLIHYPNGMEPILIRDLNVALSHMEGREKNENIEVMIAVEGLEDMVTKLITRRGWRKHEVESHTDYLLATDQHSFLNLLVR